MWRIDKGWVYIADNTIQSNSGRVNSCTDKWSLYVGSRTFSEYSLEHQLTSNNLKNTSRNNLEREIDVSVSTIKIMSSGIDDADDVELHTDETVADLSPRIAYNFHHEEFLAGLQYNAPRLDYEKLGYGEHKAVPLRYDAEQEYEKQAQGGDTQSDMLTTQEAAETFMNLQYHAIQGNVNEVSSEDRRKFSLWILFNPALFKMFESQQGLTRDVNYTMN